MNTLSKALVGSVAAGAMALTPIVAQAQQGRGPDRRDHDGISAGEVIAGALIIGGIAAVAASASRNNNRYDGRYDNRYGNNGYRDNPRQAVEQCVNAAERGANRYSYGNRAKVTDVRSIDRKRDGFVVKGRIAVNTQGRNWRAGDNRYGRGWGNDYRGWNDRYAGYDSGKFTCRIAYGRVVDLDYSGIRGL